MVLGTLRRDAEAEATLDDALARFEKVGDARMASGTQLYRAMHFERCGRLDEARAALAAAVHGLTHSPMLLATQQAQLSRVLLRQGDAALADRLAREAGDQLEREGAEMGEFLIWLTLVEAADAVGDRDRAAAAHARARARLLAQAALIHSPERRRMFLEDVPENAQLMAWKPRP